VRAVSALPNRESIIYGCLTLRTISLHDTRTGRVRPLEPRDPGRVGIYACGPTVYGRVHVGNARPFVIFSLLKRFLAREGQIVTFVANITDVNDKIYAAAAAEGVPSAELARDMGAAYIADTDALGLGRPDHEPLASETMSEIIGLIGSLLDSGHAYPAEGDVYFSVRSYPKYGELSHRDVNAMDQGEGVEGSDLKRDPLDFALWKAQKDSEDTAWDSPWGRGRPGWHIECSAMAETLLGVDFDIHGGGSDLIFPHHENEAAQTGAARGRPLARLWMHNGMVRIKAPHADEEQKMAKSVGNVFLLHEALASYGRDTLIMYFIGGHYHQPVTFDDERLDEAAARVRRVREAGRALVDGPSPDWSEPLKERFFDSLAQDYNTPRALAALFDWVREANRAGGGVGDADLREMLDVLALANLLDEVSPQAPPEAVALSDARERARAERDWPAADRLRDELLALGWEVRDGPDGPELRPR
jgi:cysteinyl-tRNA synthetase